MEKAKAAVRDFVSKSGNHDTTVHERVAPAVKHETVKPTQHEQVHMAVDREVHQDHYHHTVQPIHDKEVLPEQHKHNVGAVEHREFDHRDHDHTKKTLAAEAQKLKNERVVADTTYTQSHAPVTQGERVHHHVHETVQPVIHKEVIQPSVIHTTVPVHEVHHNAAQHHATSVLPPVTMSEFKKTGGVMTGHDERTKAFDGCPDGVHSHGQSEHSVGNGVGDGGKMSSSSSASSSNGEKVYKNGGMNGHSQVHTAAEGVEPKKKPGLLAKLNPLKDADGDGKKGFMD